MKTKLQLTTLLFGLICTLTFGQTPQLPQINMPTIPQPASLTPQSIFQAGTPYTPPDPMDMFWGQMNRNA